METKNLIPLPPPRTSPSLPHPIPLLLSDVQVRLVQAWEAALQDDLASFQEDAVLDKPTTAVPKVSGVPEPARLGLNSPLKQLEATAPVVDPRLQSRKRIIAQRVQIRSKLSKLAKVSKGARKKRGRRAQPALRTPSPAAAGPPKVVPASKEALPRPLSSEPPGSTICVAEAKLLMPNLHPEAEAVLGTLPAACSPQIAGKGGRNFTIRADEGRVVCEVQLGNKCFRAPKTVAPWGGRPRTFFWSARSPFEAWAEFVEVTQWPSN